MQFENISDKELQLIRKEVQALLILLKETYPCPELRREWIPRNELMNYLGFGATQMAAITKKYQLRKVNIGKRTFYNYKQLLDIMNSQE